MTSGNRQAGSILAQPSLACAWAERVKESEHDRALRFRDVAWTYGQLDAEAAMIADSLLRLALPPKSLVGVCLPRGNHLVAAILGIVIAGHGYVPLDPAYPDERLCFIADDAQLAAVVCRAAERNRWPSKLPAVCPEDLPARAVASWGPPRAEADDVAYVIYTSGSTGTPKGVRVSHRNVIELLRHALPLFQLDASDVWTLFHSCSFDFSVWEMWGALLTGAQLTVVETAVAPDAVAFVRLLATERVTVLNAVPSVFRHLLAAYTEQPMPLALRYVIFGGEALDPVSVERFSASVKGCEPLFVNMYGITEATIHTTFHLVDIRQLADPASARLIGHELGHLKVTLMAGSQPAAPGEVGEMWISGTGVALGYLHRPALSAQRFVVREHGGSRTCYFRTGDLAIRRPDGALSYVGRADSQVKIHGFRIEPGEVEAVLARNPAVLAAAVIARQAPSGDAVLVAYIVPAPGSDPKTLRSGLRRGLAARLPRHLIPTVFRMVAALPLTPSGKLDRLQLADAAPGAEAAGAEPAAGKGEAPPHGWDQELS
jgi:amino acid adenylation domain-containing protein